MTYMSGRGHQRGRNSSLSLERKPFLSAAVEKISRDEGEREREEEVGWKTRSLHTLAQNKDDMAGGAHYLELSRLPVSFEPLEEVESAFFDQSNFQMFCVQHGFTDVRVKGLREEDSFKITIPARGPVSTIKFSPGSPRVLSVQRRKTSVEFVNIFSDQSTERSLPLRNSGNSEILGFYWVFKNEYVVLVSTAGVELYQCNPYRMAFKLVKSFNLNISWAIFSHKQLVLVVCSRGQASLHPFVFKEGTSSVVSRLPRFEVDLPTSREVRPVLMEREVMIASLYGTLYVAVMRGSAQAGQGAEVLLYQLLSEAPARLAHVLSIDMSGRFTLSMVDNLVVVHHQGMKTSLLFDIAYEGELPPATNAASYRRHSPILAPLSIAPTQLEVRRRRSRGGSPAERTLTSASLTPRELADPDQTLTSASLTPKELVVPELYSPKWVFFPPNIIVEAQHGVIWELKLNLSAVSNMMSDKCVLLQFLLMRRGGKEVILQVFSDSLEPGRQSSLGVLGGMFDQISHAYKTTTTPSSETSVKKYEVCVLQKDIYTQVFVPFVDRKDMQYKFLVAVVVEYIRSLNKLAITVEHFLLELIMNLLIENKCYYQLHQFLQYHVISDSKPLAFLLLSRELVYPPATQLAMDMFKRLSTADSEIIDILLTRGQILTALRFIKSTDKVDSVSARQFLEAAANEDDKSLFYTVYTFFVARNMRLRRRPDFPPDEHCLPHEALFKKWFGDKT